MRFFLCFCAMMLAAVSPAFAQDEAELVKKVKAKLDKVNDYTAEGKMKIDVSFIDAPDSKVTVYYKKPDKFKVKKSGGISILPKGGVSVNVGTLLGNGQYDIVAGKDTRINGVDTKVVKLLPFVRTSPDHGTAFDIAGKNKADATSFITAVFECINIITHRKEYDERNKNPLRKITAEVLKNVEDEKIDDTIDSI